MGRVYQAARKGRRDHRKYKRSSVPAFKGNHPFKAGTVVRVRIMKPKKPNSANRKITKIRLKSTKKQINCYIPGQGHTLQQHNEVIVRGGRVKDLPGIRYHIIRGMRDFQANERIIRTHRLSKYGISTKEYRKNKDKEKNNIKE